MHLKIIHFKEGIRYFLTSLKHRFKIKKHHGSAEEICQKTIDSCWNGRFFQVSTTSFPQFWTRDFGWCCKSLLELGHKDKVHQTLRYALNRFTQTNRLTTTLTPKGKPYDFPYISVDTLPYLIHSIKIARFPYQQYQRFLNWQIREFFDEIIDQTTGLVKPDKNFSSMKDFSLRKSSCYDNCMVAMLAKDLKEMKLNNPFSKYNYPKLIKSNFWNGEFFYDDLTKKEYVAGDANIFPFILGIINDKEMMKRVIKTIRREGLDYPFPLKYAQKNSEIKFVGERILFKDYETDSVWMHMGPIYVKMVKSVYPDLAEEYKMKYKEVIEQYGNFLEVFLVEKGKVRPYSTFFYFCAQDMLWAANYLTL